ncbi:MAG TPA: acetyl-CoA carboxylase biotin carboxyl carrier protein [Verrucomicrobiae bacterium]|jgi:acetyl-CoA carboxylase biotin carboxyl carrier protein|nr:acetyl-CoA carboxylase biotin carboxyl carrier protein [Verrucomicrobiae bacterium]
MELKDIKAIIDLMRKNGLSEFELERSEFKIKLKRPMGMAAPIQEDSVVVPFPAAALPAAAPAVIPPPIAAPAATPTVDVKSPMIGTFYRAPSPESADYVEVGTEVNPETVVCLIEAMKVMNEIKAEAKGVITHILVENAKPVEFGQPLFRLRPT